ncbi:MAG: hypothetical protein RLZZ292_127 [Bacteroidota bacterium]|jgi:predicted MPP superfamily phosphohydrolase
MRFLFLALFLLLIDYAAFKSVSLATQDWSGTARQIVAIIYWTIPVFAFGLFVSYVLSGRSAANQSIFNLLRILLVLIYVGKILTIGMLLIDSLRLLMLSLYASVTVSNYDPSRSKFLAQLGILAASVPVVLLSYGIIRNAYRYKVWRHTLFFDHLPAGFEGLKIVQISDIHAGSFREKEPIKHGIELINQENADLVFFTGDLVNNKADEMDNFIDIFDKIKAKYGVFSITGNHDYGDYTQWESREAKIKNFTYLQTQHAKLGWQLLMNEHKVLTINNIKVAIIGIENYSGMPQFAKYGSLPKAYNNVPSTDLQILLSHDPTHWDYEIREKFPNIDLTLSGHTHGFQFGIEIPGWLRWSPSQYMFKQWAGLYQEGKQYLHVNRGFGFLGYPGRVGILPEITVLEIKRK